MGHTRADWETRIRAALGDYGVLQRVSAEKITMGLEAAIDTLSNDAPRHVTEAFDGDGSTYDFTISGTGDDAWIDRWSRVVLVEYPAGQREPQFLEERRWAVLPGTATFRLFTDVPASGSDNLKVTYTARWPYPTDTATDDDIPAAWFVAVASLAAAEAARAEAAEAARQSSASVAGERFERPADPLWAAAKALERRYLKVVRGIDENGSGEPRSEPYMTVEDMDAFSQALFHRRVAARGYE